MSLFTTLHRIDPVLRALAEAGARGAADDAAGMQLYDAARLGAAHHPPLNPDLGALLPVPADDVGADAVQRVLLNQYPPEHDLHLVRGDPPTVRALTLAALGAEALHAGDVLYVPPLPQASSFERFQETIAHLRAPEGCPWDRKQTHASLRPYLLEETYEVLDALDAGNLDALREELGDLLLQIVLHSQIAVDAGRFRMADVIAHIQAKIVHRHPHVWGDVDVNDENDVKTNWDRLKQAEKRTSENRQSRLDGVPRSLPALSQALSYQDRAARVRFDWPTIEPVIAKVHEELDELLAATTADERAAEAGDLLFAVVNLARWLDVDPESALRGTNGRFYRRFNYIEQQAEAQGRALDEMPLDDMDALWDAAKQNGL